MKEKEWENDVNNVCKASEVSFLAVGSSGLQCSRFMSLELSQKSFPLICEYLDWRRPEVLVPQKKKHTDSITHQMCWFSGTGGDRTLDQQAISLPSGRITYNWTESMQKNTKHSSLSSGLQRILSALFSPQLLLSHHILFRLSHR